MDIDNYFQEMDSKVVAEFKVASEARKKGIDPVSAVEISLAKDMAERVIGLIATVAPQIKDSDVVQRIKKYEEQYGALDWRVAFKIALDVARGEVVKFSTQLEAMEVGVRIGFSYITVGTVNSCLEGLTEIKLKKRRDGKGEYFSLYFSGPIRNAGGTSAAVCVLIADYVRKNMGYAEYDPDEQEIQRMFVEVYDYHEKCVNVQYLPSREELLFLAQHVPVEVSGEPTEQVEISTYKNLPRIETNLIRGGFCLIYSSCIPLKAPKLWKELTKWGKELGMDHWSFLEQFIALQKSIKAGSSKSDGSKTGDKDIVKPKILPNYGYLSELVAGRPIFGFPMAHGGFRLRYGRSRASGLSAQSIHPATMHAVEDFLAVGTQLKVERPSKGAVYTPCDTIEGPIVRLKDGSVVRLETEELAKAHKNDIEAIIYVGDMLVSYGDFLDRAHILCPAGYCEEWWVQELEEAIKLKGSIQEVAKITGISELLLQQIVRDPLRTKLAGNQCIVLSEKLGIPLHPYYTLHWKAISLPDLYKLLDYFGKADVVEKEEYKIMFPSSAECKKMLELIGVPHLYKDGRAVVVGDFAKTLDFQLGSRKHGNITISNDITILDLIKQLSGVVVRDKSGTFIGCRMGRPEKGKMRKMIGSPHGLIPVGEEGGRLRSINEAVRNGKVTADFVVFKCGKCFTTTIYPTCEKCGEKAEKFNHCKDCGYVKECSHNPRLYENRSIDVRHYFNDACKILSMTLFPEVIKGVRGTMNKNHFVEHMTKAILRAKYAIYVNKDGTIRYDAIEVPLTHFKPFEINVTVEDLHKLGYDVDMYGEPLMRMDQICELAPQDIVLPGCSLREEGADVVFVRVAQFIDELLEKVYGVKPFYNVKDRRDLLGACVIGLAPHISAAPVGRIIGFSENQSFMAHPLFHSALKRDCDGDEGALILMMDAFLNFSQKYLPSTRGATMDAPLVLTSIINAKEVDDMVFNLDVASRYPLAFYRACLDYKMPAEVKISLLKERLGKPEQYKGYGFTHDNGNFNAGVLVSSYKTLETMRDKVMAQMSVAKKLRSVEAKDVAELVIDKHFLKDTKGNLRKFSQQQFRCPKCMTKYRRPPIVGRCTTCGGNIIFTISEGSVIKYLDLSLELAEEYNVSSYMKQVLELTKERAENMFGREVEKQEGLDKWC